MTNYLTQAVVGPVISPLVSKEKGDFSNRMNCAGTQLKNNLTTLAQDAVVIGGSAVAAKTIAKSPVRLEKAAGIFDKIVKKFSPIRRRNIIAVGQSGTIFPTFELSRGKFAQKLLNSSKKAKVAGMILIPAALLLSYISGKHLYKMGQIDQKYTDKAKIEEYNKNNILK